MSKIYTLRLSYGEELVTQFDEDSEEYVKMGRWQSKDFLTLIEPYSVMPSQQGIGAGPFTFSGNTKQVNISTRAIILIVQTKSEFETNYKAQISGVDVSKSQSESPLMM